MIKRALGFFDSKKGKDEDEESDESDGLTDRQRRKLERRLLPGAAASQSSQRGRGRVDEDEDEDDEDDQLEDEEEEEGSGSDDEPLMPPEGEKPFRGQFRCELCPDKILLNEKLMEAHLQSAGHRKNVLRFERAKELGVEAFEAECRSRAAAREAAASGAPSRRREKNAEFWAKRREKGKKKPGSEKAKDLTAAQIEERKQQFQAKKAHRLQRKQNVVADEAATDTKSIGKKAARAARRAAAEPLPGAQKREAGAEAAAPRLNRKARRAAKFGQGAAAAAAPAQRPAAAEAPAKKRKKKRTPGAE